MGEKIFWCGGVSVLIAVLGVFFVRYVLADGFLLFFLRSFGVG